MILNFLKEYLFIISLFISFIVNAPFTYFFPEIRILFILTTLITGFYRFWNFKSFKLYLLFFVFISILILYYLINQTFLYPSNNTFFICLIFGLLAFKDYKLIITFLKIALIINFSIMIYELISFKYLINIVSENKFEIGRYQGLFSYSKENSYFILITYLYLRYFNSLGIYKWIILFSAFLTGSRTSIIFILVIILLDYILNNFNFRKIKIKKILAFALTFIISFKLIDYYLSENILIYNRILNSFNFQSSSHLDRIYFWETYLDYIFNYELIHFLVGKGTYIANTIANGAESTWLMIFSEGGLLALIIFSLPILYVSSLTFKNPSKYYPFILIIILFQFGRIAVGWADGILFWSLIFYIIFFKKTKNEHKILSI